MVEPRNDKRSIAGPTPERLSESDRQGGRRRSGDSQGGGKTNQATPEPKLQSTVALRREAGMISIKSTLLWLLGIPLPIILLIALFLHPG
jgi:hypothetical protein